jgi:hypothetical protein
MEVLWCLLTAASRPEEHEHDAWLRVIDLIYASQAAGRRGDDGDLAYVGIAAHPRLEPPPQVALGDYVGTFDQ